MMNISVEEKQDIRNRSAKPMLWMGIISICMIFGGLTSGYVVRSSDPGWYPVELPGMFLISTAVIVASSLALLLAYFSATRDNQAGIKAGLSLTLVLGIAFIYCQFLAYGALVEQGVFFGGKTSHAAGSFLYALTGAHLAHLAGGIIMLIYVCIKSFKELYHSKNLLGLQLCSIYWHFLGLLWIYLYLFINLTH